MRLAKMCPLLLCLLVAFSPFAAEGTKVDLSTPDKAIQSFFAAIKARDVQSVEKMLAPRIAKAIASGELAIEAYVAWSQYPLVRVESSRTIDTRASSKEGAIAEAFFMVNGQEHRSPVTVTKVGEEWLWDTK